MKKIVYVLGNPFLDIDNKALKVAKILQKRLPQINFIHIDPTEEFSPREREIIIIDTVHGIDKVKKFNDLNLFYLSPGNTVHDFDLPLNLGLLIKLKKIKKFTVIGIPEKGDEIEIAGAVKKILLKL